MEDLEDACQRIAEAVGGGSWGQGGAEREECCNRHKGKTGTGLPRTASVCVSKVRGLALSRRSGQPCLEHPEPQTLNNFFLPVNYGHRLLLRHRGSNREWPPSVCPVFLGRPLPGLPHIHNCWDEKATLNVQPFLCRIRLGERSDFLLLDRFFASPSLHG
jgi:hypothetical protein